MEIFCTRDPDPGLFKELFIIISICYGQPRIQESRAVARKPRDAAADCTETC